MVSKTNSYVLFLIIVFALCAVYTPCITAHKHTSKQSTVLCNCPKPTCNMKVLRCLWYILKMGIVFPATALGMHHFNETCSLISSDYEQNKAVFQFTGFLATSHFIYATLKDSYEGLQYELLENKNDQEAA